MFSKNNAYSGNAHTLSPRNIRTLLTGSTFPVCLPAQGLYLSATHLDQIDKSFNNDNPVDVGVT